MKKYLFIFATLILVLSQTGCTTTKIISATDHADYNFNSTLWMQTSAEYAANSLQTYQTASRNLPLLLADKNHSAALEQTSSFEELPPAIILDIDETVLDNSSYQAKLVLEGLNWSPESWDKWIALKQAGAIPGAVNFIHFAQKMQVKVFFVTNRACEKREGNPDPCPQKQETVDNLKSIGIKEVTSNSVLFKHDILTQTSAKNWTSEKKSRREYVAEKYHLIMLFGDNLGDFIAHVSKNISNKLRMEITYKNGYRWGYQWYMLTNPTYGSWLNALKKPRSDYFKSY